eukprot:scaffold192320_cov27-Prasinocladus_malaysianus.AAC.1
MAARSMPACLPIISYQLLQLPIRQRRPRLWEAVLLILADETYRLRNDPVSAGARSFSDLILLVSLGHSSIAYYYSVEGHPIKLPVNVLHLTQFTEEVVCQRPAVLALGAHDPLRGLREHHRPVHDQEARQDAHQHHAPPGHVGGGGLQVGVGPEQEGHH